MSKLDSQAVQDVTERIDKAYNLFFRNLERKVKISPPKFKLKQAGWGLDEQTGHIRLGKRWYGYFNSRNIEGKVKTVLRSAILRSAIRPVLTGKVC